MTVFGVVVSLSISAIMFVLLCGERWERAAFSIGLWWAAASGGSRPCLPHRPILSHAKSEPLTFMMSV
jgi:hypothetical protein